MSHIHIPDGVLPLWLVAAGWLVAGLLLAVCTRRVQGGDLQRRLPLLGVMSAVMLVGMTAEVVPIAYHLNLSTVAGIILGPVLGFLAAFVINLILALFGHGGITVVGLNTLIIGTEMALGWGLFRLLSRLLGRHVRPGIAAGIAAVGALLVSTLLMIGIVGLSSINPLEQARGIVDASGVGIIRNPFQDGLLSLDPGGEEHAPVVGRVSLATFAQIVLTLGAAGWALEAVVTGFIVGYLARLRPDLVAGRAGKRIE